MRRRVPVLVVWLLIVVALAVLARGVGEEYFAEREAAAAAAAEKGPPAPPVAV